MTSPAREPSQLERALALMEKLAEKNAGLERRLSEPLAVVGLSCRFPGGAVDPGAFWDLLEEGRDAISALEERWRWLGEETPKAAPRWAGLLDSVDGFDPAFFGIAPREAMSLDPQHRLLLEVSWEALEDAAVPPAGLSGSSTGLFVGACVSDYRDLAERTAPEERDAYHLTGCMLSIAAGRVAYTLGLEGPAMTLDTACSSSLVAVHLACRSLRNRECDLALAGGVNLILSPYNMGALARTQTLSPGGRCRTFDAAADGFVRGEGCGVVVLKRLSDARRDGDRVRAVIRGSAVNQDGRSTGLTAPNARSQRSVLEAALADAGVAAAAVSYVESHGTGTALGDPIEVEALRAVLDDDGAGPCVLGAVKTNIGHLEGAAGIAGLIKTVLALEHERIPRNLNFRTLNPRIDLRGSRLLPAREPVEWPRGSEPRLAGVNSFGLSGTNVELIVEEAPELAAAEPPAEPPLFLLPLSARQPEALRELAGRYAGYLDAHPETPLLDVCHTAALGRSHFEHRLAVSAADREELRGALAGFASSLEPSPGVVTGEAPAPPKLAFLFTGQGSQYAGMGRGLYEAVPEFREALDRCAALFDAEPDWPSPGKDRRPGLLAALFDTAGETGSAQLDQTVFTQPALFALEYALSELWRSWGVEPDLVLGHSIGELAAACAARVLSLEDAVRLVAARGRLMQALPAGGAMASARTSEERAVEALAPYRDQVSLAAVNSASSVTLSGAAEAVRRVAEALAAQGVEVKPLAVSHAFHSPLMEPMLEAFSEVAEGIRFERPEVPLLSNLTGRPAGDELCSASYWCRQARETVRFGDALDQLAEVLGPDSVCVELGPHPVLSGLGAVALADTRIAWLASLRRGHDDLRVAWASLGGLYTRGVEPDWRALAVGGRKASLPSYPFQRRRYWLEPGAPAPARRQGRSDVHPLLGRRLSSALPEVQFESRFSTDSLPFLEDHRVYGRPIFPAAAQIEIALAAAAEALGPPPHAVEDLLLGEVLPVDAGEARTLQTILKPDSGGASFQVLSRVEDEGRDGDPWTLHASGRLRGAAGAGDGSNGSPPVRLEEARKRCQRELPVETLYERLRLTGLEYGPSFQGIERLWCGDGEVLGCLRLPEAAARPAEARPAVAWRFHPALLDACLQLFAAPFLDGDETTEVFLPMGAASFRLHRSPEARLWSRVSLRPPGDTPREALEGDLHLFDEDGRTVAELRGLVLKRARREVVERAVGKRLKDGLYELVWRAADRVPAPDHESLGSPDHWLIFADRGGAGARLAELLAERGASSTLVFPGTALELSEAGPAGVDPARPEHFRRLLAGTPPCRGVVHLWSLEAPPDVDLESAALAEAQVLGCASVLHLVQALAGSHEAPPPGLWLVTRGAQAVTSSAAAAVAQAPIWGLARVIALEHPELRCRRVDLDPEADEDEVRLLSAELGSEDGEDQVAFRGGVRHLARLVRGGAAPAGKTDDLQAPGGRPCRLAIPARGELDNLVLQPLDRRPPGPGEVEIRVRATGLNFRDVLNVLGMYPGDPGPLGGECAGEVVALGEGVTDFEVGDEVLAMAAGSFSTFVTTPAALAAPRPRSLPFEAAATVPIAFLTAGFGLDRLAGLTRGERVLIHAAAGGVGMAAVQLARRAGAEVFATASPPKWPVLREMGVEHVMSSRSLEFAAEVMEKTEGRGVDVVLNSLADDFIPRSFSVLAPRGRFVEIGKRGILSPGEAAELRADVAYHVFDLSEVARRDPGQVSALFRELLAEIEAGNLEPLPQSVFPLRQAVGAFRTMAQARHVGKIVVSQSGEEPAGTSVVPSGERSVLVTGGLGALGLRVARWLVERGARRLVLMGRRGPSEAAAEVLEELEAAGARVVVAEGDVSRERDVARVLAETAALAPLGGVVHAAGMLDDGVLVHQDWARFAAVMAPKVAGAWNLHRLTRDLDFFVCFSSAAALLGSPGQGSYAAANAFLDALAHHRRARGLPASSIDWGPWSGTGMAADGSRRDQARWSSLGITPLTPDQGLAVLERALGGAPAQLAALAIDWRRYLAALPGAAAPPLVAELAREVRTSEETRPPAAEPAGMARRLREAGEGERRELLEAHLRDLAVRVLGLDPAHPTEPERPLAELGLDSLMAVELRNALGASLGQTLPATLLFDYPTLKALADYLLREALASAPSPAPSPAAERRSAAAEPVAILGMGLRFPGGAGDPDTFWQSLLAGEDAITEVPPERWNVDAFYDPDPDAPGKMSTRHGGFLEDVDLFDAGFFSIAPREAMSMDPQQRLLLEVGWEALEDAGQVVDRLKGSRTGVYFGISSNDYGWMRFKEDDPESIDAYFGTGNSASVAAGRFSYLLGLEGPCLALDTACSSSLVTAHLACQALRNGECDLALAGGVSLILSPEGTIYFSKLRAMAADGRCKTFDRAADGYVRSEGCGVVVLKRLGDALTDGDPIVAVVRGSAVNQDGRSGGLTAPNGPSQERVIRQALANAGVEPSEVGYVEAHGTGTALGDPIEVQALARSLGAGRAADRRLLIGSVKTNLGHLEAAAGVAGLAKAALALRHGEIPPHLHFEEPNPHIPWDELPVEVVRERTPWPAGGGPRFAGVSAFGFSGTNAHLVLEEAPPREAEDASRQEPPGTAHLVPLSARHPEVLESLARRYRELVARPETVSLREVARTAGLRRGHHPHRLALVAKSPEELDEKLAAFVDERPCPGAHSGAPRSSERPKVVFVFPGQGSQWLGMGRQLLAEEETFRRALEACGEAFEPFVDWSLPAELDAEPERSRLGEIDVVQPVLFAVQVALAALWRSWGIEPDAVIGTSMGEVAAAQVAGALSLEDAARVICRRSRLLRRASGQGEMGVVELSLDEAREVVAPYADRLAVAVSNSPRSTVLSGDPEALGEVFDVLGSRGTFCRRVKVDVASHSPQMDPLRKELLEVLSGLEPRPAAIPIYSTVSGEATDGAGFDAAYWVRNLRSTVLFAPVVGQLSDAGHDVFVEVSPHPVLLPAIHDTLRGRGREGEALASLRREEDEREALLTSLGSLWVLGQQVDWSVLHPGTGRCPRLPTYPWRRERYWWPDMAEGSGRRRDRRPSASGHPLLGERLELAAQPGTYGWHLRLGSDVLAYLGDHRVFGRVVLPGAAYLEIALAAAAEAFGETPHCLEDVTFSEALVLREEEHRELQLVLAPERPGAYSLRFFSRPSPDGRNGDEPGTAWTLHAAGTIRLRPEAESPAPDPSSARAIRTAGGEAVAAGELYRDLARRGLEYGSTFQGLAQSWRRNGEALALLRPPPAVASAAARYRVHPAILDACFQAVALTEPEHDGSAGDAEPYLPTGLGSLRVWRPPGAELQVHARVSSANGGDGAVREADLFLFQESGELVLEARGLRLRRPDRGARRSQVDEFRDALFELRWLPEEARSGPAGEEGKPARGNWLVLMDGGGVGERLATLLEERGGTCVRAWPGEPPAAGGRRVDPDRPESWARLFEEGFSDDQPCRGIVHLWSLGLGSTPEESSLALARELGPVSVVHLVQALAQAGWRDAPRLWLVTGGVWALEPQTSPALVQAPTWGLGATLVHEHSELRPTRVDLSPEATPVEVRALAEELCAASREDQIALRGDARHVARLARSSPEAGEDEAPRIPAGDRPFRLEIPKPGVLDRLVLRSVPGPAPGPGEVEIEVRAASLNYLDVLKAMGAYPGAEPGGAEPGGAALLGGDGAGVVTRVGEGVEGLAAGDEVMAVAAGSIASSVVTLADLVVPKPSALTFEEAAGVPVVFVTAHYALNHLARLAPGERVLIHSASGGTGLAALALAREAGAEVFATAGSEEKREYLRSLGVEHVMDSRTLDFAAAVMELTGGRGVDVVLNSLSGEAIAKGLSILSPHGRFLEISKRDIYQDSRLGLAPFRRNLSYFAVDMARMARERPDRFGALLREVREAFERGRLEPVPHRLFPVSQAVEAFHLMARARHVGKIVLTFDGRESVLVQAAEEGRSFSPEATYLITGGLGGIGSKVAEWMVGEGARHLVLVGRSGASGASRRLVETLEERGARIVVGRADVTRREELARVLAEAEASLPPLAGILHCAGVLDDATVLQLDRERFDTVMAPKVDGAWNLHALTAGKPLDFFVLFSSGASLLGSPGQGNYAAANAFMDALAHYRRARGLPALAIDWGPWSQVGLAAARSERGRRLAYQGMESLAPEEGVRTLGRLLRRVDSGAEAPPAQVGVLRFDLRRWRQSFPKVAGWPLLALLDEESASASPASRESRVRSALVTAEPAERHALLEEHLVQQVAQVLRLRPGQVEAEEPLPSLGFDSLMALELRNRLEADLGLTLPATLIWKYPTIASLVPHLAGEMGIPLEGESPEGARPEEDPAPSAAPELEGLSRDELTALLAEELAQSKERSPNDRDLADQ